MLADTPLAGHWPLHRLLRLSVALTVGTMAALPSAGCRPGSSNGEPAVEFSAVPPADAGGPDRLGPIAGRVKGARPNQRIVLFARSGVWWVQPFRSRPFTSIQMDVTWKNTIHPRPQYPPFPPQP